MTIKLIIQPKIIQATCCPKMGQNQVRIISLKLQCRLPPLPKLPNKQQKQWWSRRKSPSKFERLTSLHFISLSFKFLKQCWSSKLEMDTASQPGHKADEERSTPCLRKAWIDTWLPMPTKAMAIKYCDNHLQKGIQELGNQPKDVTKEAKRK